MIEALAPGVMIEALAPGVMIEALAPGVMIEALALGGDETRALQGEEVTRPHVSRGAEAEGKTAEVHHQGVGTMVAKDGRTKVEALVKMTAVLDTAHHHDRKVMTVAVRERDEKAGVLPGTAVKIASKMEKNETGLDLQGHSGVGAGADRELLSRGRKKISATIPTFAFHHRRRKKHHQQLRQMWR